MYSLVPADEEARKAPPREPVFAPAEMIKQSRSKTSLLEPDEELMEESTGRKPKCEICNKTYKNKKSLANHKRRFHSNLPLILFADRDGENSKSETESDDDKGSTMFGYSTSRKRKISTDGDISHRKRIVSYSEKKAIRKILTTEILLKT